MSFETEWAGLVTNARSQQSASMQLNGAGTPNGGTGGGKRLQVTAHVLRAYAGRADKVSDDFQKTDNETMRETEQVPGSMKGFACDEAFKDFQKLWRDQMKYLDGLYTGVAKSLRSAATTFKAEDIRRKQDLDKTDPPPYGPYLPGTGGTYNPLLPNSPLLPGNKDGNLLQPPGPPLLNPPATDAPSS